jgi:peptide/histidine transporter 3/4
MEEADHQQPQPQHDKAYAAAVDETAITASNTKQLSDESDAGEPEENYRGWKAMPYVIGELTTPVCYIVI